MLSVINRANTLISRTECFSGPSSPWWAPLSWERRNHHRIQLLLFLINKKKRFSPLCQAAVFSKKLSFSKPFVFFAVIFSLVGKRVPAPFCGQGFCLSWRMMLVEGEQESIDLPGLEQGLTIVISGNFFILCLSLFCDRFTATSIVLYSLS